MEVNGFLLAMLKMLKITVLVAVYTILEQN